MSHAQNYGVDPPDDQRLLGVLVDQIEVSDGAPTMVPALHDPRLRDVQAIVEADLTRTWTLLQLGQAVGASQRTLSRLFRAEVGMSFPVWRHQLRLHRVTMMLARGDTVTRVAASCGYASASAFVTVFRKAFGRTPGSLHT